MCSIRLHPLTYIGLTHSDWIHSVRLDPVSQIGSSQSDWIHSVRLDPVSQIGSTQSYWIHSLRLDLSLRLDSFTSLGIHAICACSNHETSLLVDLLLRGPYLDPALMAPFTLPKKLRTRSTPFNCLYCCLFCYSAEK
jgi:hypothetical protein